VTLADIVERFKGLRILVAGDPMVDVYHFGRVERLSQEAPVPVFVEERIDKRMGGAANVWNQLMELNIDAVPSWPLDTSEWTEKHRYLVGSHQLFRVDYDRKADVVAQFKLAVPPAAIVISDYGKGSCSRFVCETLIRKNLNVPVIVDPKGEDWDKYVGAAVICPNAGEWAEHINGRAPTRPVFAAVALKQGADGIVLMRRDKVSHEFPAQAKHVFDVTGAGDTVTAVMAATVAAGGTLEQACQLANLAAGWVVGEVGTTVCPVEKLYEMAHEN
jgi:rfaE bifunctional protein kinase chain/domain